MKTHLFIILISLSFSGCSLIYSYSDNLPQQLNQWMAEKKYNKALNTISYIKPKHKDYRSIQRIKNIILKKMAEYEEAAINDSTQLANKGNWLQAISRLDEAAENILDTRKIEKQRENLLKQRNYVIEQYETDLLNKQASNLISKVELYNKIKKTVLKNERNDLDIAEFDEMRQETSTRLAKRSEAQFKKGDYAEALSTIELALKLQPEDEITAQLNEIKDQINKTTKINKKLYLTEAKELLNKLSQGYSHAILKETKDKITWLEKIHDDDKDYLSLIKKLKKHLKAGIKQNFEAARKLYSKGKTQEALSIWIDLKEIDPEHPKLQSYINRAEKVIRKLKELSDKPDNKN